MCCKVDSSLLGIPGDFESRGEAGSLTSGQGFGKCASRDRFLISVIETENVSGSIERALFLE